MADEETGSWWQQISGECILGPLKGKRLRRISSDEVALATWRTEHPESAAVKFDPRYSYPGSDWEKQIEQLKSPDGSPRELVVGVELDGVAAAYPLEALREPSPLNAQVGGTPVVFVVGGAATTVRRFAGRGDGPGLGFYPRLRRAGATASATGHR